MSNEEMYMQRCIQLALLGQGYVTPNPMVGAVLVHNNTIIGEGYHAVFGGPHAEVNCINSVNEEDKHLIANSTLYVSLEPCSHFGKTPPCANFIVAQKIKHVVIGCADPSEKVNGEGIRILHAAGITTKVGVLQNACVHLNKIFFYNTKMLLPYITTKWAQSKDGLINKAGTERSIISNLFTQRHVHHIRQQHQAILVGRSTIEVDNPKLDSRYWFGKSLVVIIIDKLLKLNITDYNIAVCEKLIIINTIKNSIEGNIQFIKVENSETSFEYDLCKKLFDQKIYSILIEGGAYTLGKFIAANLVSEIVQVVGGNIYLHAGVPAPVMPLTSQKKMMQLKNDEIITWSN